jgi:CheY-like chemotaxis protein
MLTALEDVSDKVRGLDSSAYDYLTKPFSISNVGPYSSIEQRSADYGTQFTDGDFGKGWHYLL